jgi:hypothetical protein
MAGHGELGGGHAKAIGSKRVSALRMQQSISSVGSSSGAAASARACAENTAKLSGL